MQEIAATLKPTKRASQLKGSVAYPDYVVTGVPYFEQGYRGPLMLEGAPKPPNPASAFVRAVTKKIGV